VVGQEDASDGRKARQVGEGLLTRFLVRSRVGSLRRFRCGDICVFRL
jgi:hypothetical protein